MRMGAKTRRAEARRSELGTGMGAGATRYWMDGMRMGAGTRDLRIDGSWAHSAGRLRGRMGGMRMGRWELGSA